MMLGFPAARNDMETFYLESCSSLIPMVPAVDRCLGAGSMKLVERMIKVVKIKVAEGLE
jgi:hypothetical protein